LKSQDIAAFPPVKSPRSPAGDKITVERDVVFRHSLRGEPLLEDFADPLAVEQVKPLGSGSGGGLVRDNKAGHPFIDDFRHRPVTHGKDWGPAGHRFYHRQPERLAPIDREYQPHGITEELGFLVLGDLTDEFDVRLRQKRFDFLFEILPIDAVDLGCDL
jgi:hypothetical protein